MRRCQQSRYQDVMENARFLRTNRVAMNTHLRKSKVCYKPVCMKKSECGFAHSIEDYNPPVCIYQEFCNTQGCAMFHPHRQTVNEFMKQSNIVFVNSSPDDRRVKEVIDHATFLKENKDAMSKHLHKSKVCTNLLCSNKEECDFAHSLDDFKPAVCLYQEFCENKECAMFHPHRQTVEEYIASRNITFKTSIGHQYQFKPYVAGAFTKMCSLMTNDTPCPREWCTFAHSIYELHFSPDLVCYHYHPKTEICKKFHPNQCKCCPHDRMKNYDVVCQELLHFVVDLGYHIEPFMTRCSSKNRAMYVKLENEQKKLIEELMMETDDEQKEVENVDDDEDDKELNVVIEIPSLSELLKRENENMTEDMKKLTI
jgi:hypothetical protein